MRTRSHPLVLCWCALILLGATVPALAQSRYDNLPPAERWSVSLGGSQEWGYDTKLRLDSKTLGIGTVVELEDDLDVDSSVSNFRIKGMYRFNGRHRLDLDYFGWRKEGRARLVNDPIQVGDIVFDVGDRVQTVWKQRILKIGWAYSFINVRKYEFYIGAGFNVRSLSLDLENSFSGGGQMQVQKVAEDASVPLPVVNTGGRWNFTDRLQLNWEYQSFSLRYGDIRGSLHESTIRLEHDTFGHFGFGGAISSFLFDLQYEGSEFNGEVETRHATTQIYLKIYGAGR